MALNVSLFRLLFGGEAAVTDRKISSSDLQRIFIHCSAFRVCLLEFAFYSRNLIWADLVHPRQRPRDRRGVREFGGPAQGRADQRCARADAHRGEGRRRRHRRGLRAHGERAEGGAACV